MAETWPAELPCAFVAGTTRRGPGENQLRSENAQGPAKVRPRATSTPRPLSGVMHMTEAQFAIFESFYYVTLIEGSLVVDFPFRGSTVEARFTDWAADDPAAGKVSVAMTLERMP